MLYIIWILFLFWFFFITKIHALACSLALLRMCVYKIIKTEYKNESLNGQYCIFICCSCKAAHKIGNWIEWQAREIKARTTARAHAHAKEGPWVRVKTWANDSFFLFHGNKFEKLNFYIGFCGKRWSNLNQIHWDKDERSGDFEIKGSRRMWKMSRRLKTNRKKYDLKPFLIFGWFGCE